MKFLKASSLLSFLFAMVFSLSAQEKAANQTSADFFPKKGDFGASIIVDGLIDNIDLASFSNNYGQNVLFAKYYVEDDLAVRMGVGFSLNSFKRETADSVGLSLREVDSTASRFLFNVSAGIEKHLKPSNKRLDPFVFAQIDLTFIGKTNTETDERFRSSAGVSSTKKTIKTDGGIAFGLLAGGGMNYFLAQRFSVGTELSLGFNVVSEGGTTSTNEVFTPINGNPTSDFTTEEDRVTTTSLAVSPNALINISYFF